MPPSLNNAYPSNRQGVRFKSKEFREWENDFRLWALGQNKALTAARAEFHTPRSGHSVWIQSDFYFQRAKILTKDGRPKRNDTTNRIKMLHDGVSSAIWLDDCYFWDGTFTKHISTTSVDYCSVTLEWRKKNWDGAKSSPPTTNGF